MVGELPADDYLSRSTPPHELAARVKLALRLKDAEERSDRMTRHLLATNGQLEEALRQRDTELYQAQDVLIFAMAKMAELRGQETGAHLLRMQGYVRVLAEEAMRLPAFAGRIDGAFTRMLERCVLLHDIGKVAIPDHILLKPGRLDAEERSIMESHTVPGPTSWRRWPGSTAPAWRSCKWRSTSCAITTSTTTAAATRMVCPARPSRWRRASLRWPTSMTPCAASWSTSRACRTPRLAVSSSTPTKGQFDPALLVAFRNAEANFQTIFEQFAD